MYMKRGEFTCLTVDDEFEAFLNTLHSSVKLMKINNSIHFLEMSLTKFWITNYSSLQNTIKEY